MHETLMAVLVCLNPCFAVAKAPIVQFDVASIISCRDVRSDACPLDDADERLVEASFPVSALIHRGREEDIVEYLYRIESPQRSVQVFDYLPKTTLTTDLAGKISLERKDEEDKSVGLAVSGSYGHVIKATPSAGFANKQTSTLRYELLPPRDVLAASGTIRRAHGVYFKLKPSKQTSLEGGKEFVLVLRAPATWRADVMHIHCSATGYHRGLVDSLDEQTQCGSGDFVIALHLDVDKEAKSIAEQFVRAESRLRRTAAAHRDEIIRRAMPKFALKTSWLTVAAERRMPPDWLNHVVFHPSLSEELPRDFSKALPAVVRDAVDAYREARANLLQLNCGN